MMNCQLVVELLSRSLDGRLTLCQHLIVRLHILRCAECRRHARQFLFLRAAAHRLQPELRTGKQDKDCHKQPGNTSRR